ncbi:Alpha/beta hydrolase fold-3 [Artemisia annua]|uniref:Alpha/beta hydrolase fold-3 n=1 Tax=Artemisia annua TaxID=35608 RepID=A0A2U1L979_ARTAN|nr:Alpha/beta hydrolase fold-3 [Artemisia annua]
MPPSVYQVIGVVAIQPFFGGEERTNSEIELKNAPIVSPERTDWYWKAFMPPGEGYNRDHPIINVSGPNAVDISKLDFPATIVVVAGFDSLQDWQKRYYEWLKKSGKEAYLVEYPNMCHAFYLFLELPESEQVMSEVKDFIHKVLEKCPRKMMRLKSFGARTFTGTPITNRKIVRQIIGVKGCGHVAGIGRKVVDVRTSSVFGSQAQAGRSSYSQQEINEMVKKHEYELATARRETRATHDQLNQMVAFLSDTQGLSELGSFGPSSNGNETMMVTGMGMGIMQ